MLLRSILEGLDEEHLIEYRPAAGSLGMIKQRPGGLEKYNQSNSTFLDDESYIDILAYLIEEDNQNPNRHVNREDVIENLDLSELEIEQNIWYLHKKRQVDLMQAIGSTWVGAQVEQFGRRAFKHYKDSEEAKQKEVEEQTLTDSEYDVFISHASEDKPDIARPLAEKLQELGATVWLDEFELEIGDDLRESIDDGLKKSRYGIVVLSDSFFGKEWTEYELEGLTARDMHDDKVILPVWYDISQETVMEYSPSLANKMAAKIDEDCIGEVASEIYGVMK
ncbi:TIR domain-containing protein [Halomicrobium mukohataei]|uniref:TIR domain-containing protein n=2 Tax=Halomicrobium mukohataei TaxID=57705 RepID=A0A847U942_9EURY|nr:TIR domain-containing protein [Halomicrobium mukohataei]